MHISGQLAQLVKAATHGPGLNQISPQCTLHAFFPRRWRFEMKLNPFFLPGPQPPRRIVSKAKRSQGKRSPHEYTNDAVYQGQQLQKNYRIPCQHHSQHNSSLLKKTDASLSTRVTSVKSTILVICYVCFLFYKITNGYQIYQLKMD